MRLICFTILLLFICALAGAQTLGIGTDFPDATLHIVNDVKKTALRIDVDKDNSSYALEINQYSKDFASYTIMDSNYTAHFTDLSTSGGIGHYVSLEDADGSGFFAYNLDLTNPSGSALQGDGFLHDGLAYSITPPTATETFGAVFGGDQYGNSVAAHFNQWGSVASNTLLFTFNTSNPEPVLKIGDSGYGGAIYASNDNDNPPLGWLIDVMSSYYLGNDNTLNHTAMYAESFVENGVGIGHWGVGGAFGVVGETILIGATPMQWGVFSAGDFGASGGKLFFIDLPSDPENYFLKHFAIESDEALNVYRGNATIARHGKVIVELPKYFQDINTDFTYQLTAMGPGVQPYVKKKISGNQFEIGGRPGMEVSWMVIASRNDPYFAQHPQKRVNVVPKSEMYEGKYIHPELYGQPQTKGIFYRPETTDQASPAIKRNSSIPDTERRHQVNDPVFIRKEIKTWDEIH